MSRGGATSDENSVLPWTRGDFRGFWEPSRQPPEGFAFFPPLVRGISSLEKTSRRRETTVWVSLSISQPQMEGIFRSVP